MKKLISRIPLIISAVIFVAITAGFYFAYQQIVSKNIQVEQILNEIDQENVRRSEIKLLNDSIESIKVEREMISTHFSKSNDVVPFLNDMESLGSKAGANVEVSSVDILKDNSALDIKLTVSGTFQNVYKFIKLIENSQYIIQIDNLSMHKDLLANTDLEQSQNTILPDNKWQAVLNIKLLSFTP